jgi:hypothetical protein
MSTLAHDALEHGAFTLRRPGKRQALDERAQNIFDELRLPLAFKHQGRKREFGSAPK